MSKLFRKYDALWGLVISIYNIIRKVIVIMKHECTRLVDVDTDCWICGKDMESK